MAANAYLKAQITGHIIEIINEFIAIPAFPYFKSVFDVLLDRYSITNTQSLGFASNDDIPILKWLHILDSKVSSFLSIYFSTSHGSVQTIADLDNELFHYLTNLNFPTIASFDVDITIKEPTDPNEIDIDIEDTTPIPSTGRDIKSHKVSTFDYFGLGPLSHHHIITTHFRLTNTTGTVLYAVTPSEILSHFLEFTSINQQFQHKDFDIHSFQSYLLSIYNITSLSDIGVILCGDFSAEYLSYKCILNRHQQRLIDIQRQQLKQWNDQASLQHNGNNYDPTVDLIGTNTIPLQPLQPTTTPSSSSSILSIKPSTRPLITQFMTQFDAVYQSTRGDNPYSPSFTQVYDILTTSTLGYYSSLASNTNHTSNKTSKKRRIKEVEKMIDNTSLSHMLTEVITDYLMLSEYGGTRFMKKRISVSPHNSYPTPLPADDLSEADDIGSENENVSTAAVNDEICEVSGTGAEGSETKAYDTIEISLVETAASSTMVSKTVVDSSAVSGSIATLTSQPLPTADIRKMYSSEAPIEPAAPEYEGKTQWKSPTNTSHKVIVLTPESIHNPSIRSLLFNNDDRGDSTIYTLYLRDLQACLGPYISDDSFISTNTNTQIAHHSGRSTSGASAYTELPRRVGIWGERLVYHILLLLSPPDAGATVHWLNEHEETRASYDILLTYKPSTSPSSLSLHKSTHPPSENRQYIEVKTTRYNDNNIFELSLQEWEFATAMPRVQYSIYRVYNAGQLAKARVVVVPDVLRYIQCKEVKMCLALPSLG